MFNILPADRGVGELLVRHPLVDKISFTGSTSAGRRIAALCGEQIKRCSLELGGKSAAIVLPDADLDAVIGDLAPNTMRNNGQTCTNATRVLAPRRRYAEVVEALREEIAGVPVGDPADPDVGVGPLVSHTQRERVERYIATGRDEGARLVLGGGRPDRDRGYFVEPTIFADVDNAMTIAQEEIFGPVVCVIPYDDTDHAVAIANDSSYGLSGSVWGPDAEQAKAVARRIHSGTVGVNQHILDPAGPFGGVKQSGLGRENGIEGIDAYVELQTIPYGDEDPGRHLGKRPGAVRDRRGRAGRPPPRRGARRAARRRRLPQRPHDEGGVAGGDLADRARPRGGRRRGGGGRGRDAACIPGITSCSATAAVAPARSAQAGTRRTAATFGR